MKKAMKSRNASMLIMVVVIALSVVGGSFRSLNKESRKVEKLFYNTSGTHHSSGQGDFASRIGLCSNLLVVADRYMDDADPAMASLKAAIDNANHAGDIWQVAETNRGLAVAFDSLYLTLGEYDLTDTDANYRGQIVSNFNSYGDILRRAEYNTAAAEFNQDILGKVPARYLAALTGVKALPTFD